MPKYRARVTSFVNNRIVEAGDEVDITGEVGSNFEPIDKAAKQAQAEPVPAAVAQLVSAVRLHAATRGVAPSEVAESDFDEVMKDMEPKPSTDTVKAAAKEIGIELGQSVA